MLHELAFNQTPPGPACSIAALCAFLYLSVGRHYGTPNCTQCLLYNTKCPEGIVDAT